MSTHSFDLLTIYMTETHVHPTDNDSLICFITPVGFKLCHRPHVYRLGSGVGFLSIEISSS